MTQSIIYSVLSLLCATSFNLWAVEQACDEGNTPEIVGCQVSVLIMNDAFIEKSTGVQAKRTVRQLCDQVYSGDHEKAQQCTAWAKGGPKSTSPYYLQAKIHDHDLDAYQEFQKMVATAKETLRKNTIKTE